MYQQQYRVPRENGAVTVRSNKHQHGFPDINKTVTVELEKVVKKLCDSIKSNDALTISTHWIQVAINRFQQQHIQVRGLSNGDRKDTNPIQYIQQLFELVLFVPFRLGLDATTFYLFGMESANVAIFGIQRTALSESTQVILKHLETNHLNYFKKVNFNFSNDRYTDFYFDTVLNDSDIRRNVAITMMCVLLQPDFKSDFNMDIGRTIIGVTIQNIITQTYYHSITATDSSRQYSRAFELFDIKLGQLPSIQTQGNNYLDGGSTSCQNSQNNQNNVMLQTLIIVNDFAHLLQDPSGLTTVMKNALMGPSHVQQCHQISHTEHSKVQRTIQHMEHTTLAVTEAP